MKNNFDYKPEDPKVKNTKCPFAAHVRKMRPRADHYVQRGEESEEVHAKNFVNSSNVILRRSITFGPEVDPETEKEKSQAHRGIYFLCYQGSIRAGFNFMVTRKFFSPCHIPIYQTLILIGCMCFQAGQAAKSSPSTKWSVTAPVSMLSSARETVQTMPRVG